LQLSEADLSYWRQAVSRGEITIAELARRWGISRPSAHAVIRGSYRAK
jgi:predicted DNA binding protein